MNSIVESEEAKRVKPVRNVYNDDVPTRGLVAAIVRRVAGRSGCESSSVDVDLPSCQPSLDAIQKIAKLPQGSP